MSGINGVNNTGISDSALVAALRRQMTISVARQVAAAGNLANVDTPDYKAVEVNFQSALDERIAPPAATHASHFSSKTSSAVQVQEIQAINYPFFVDVRPNGMDRQSPILANLPAVTLNWASPVTVDAQKNANRTVTTLLNSSPGSWLRTDTNIQPDLQTYPEVGFAVEGEQKSRPLAVSVQGVFESYFKGKESPLAAAPAPAVPDPANPALAPTPAATPPNTIGTIESSPDTARLVVIGSAEFLNDLVFQLSANLTQDRYLNSLQFTQNTVDWSVEDLDLLGIRSRGTSARVLNPLTEREQSFWEGINYGLALLALVGLGFVWRWRQQNEQPMELVPQTATVSGQSSVVSS